MSLNDTMRTPTRRGHLSLLGLACTLLLSLPLVGCGNSDSSTDTNKTADTKKSDNNDDAPPPTAGGPAGVPGMPTGQGQQAAAAPAGPPQKLLASTPGVRYDPFKPTWSTVTPPTPVLSQIAPVRLAVRDSQRIPQTPVIEIQEVPTRRVSGILTGNGVYALLEGPDGTKVVKPGDDVDGYRVASINPDSVVLKRKFDRQVFTQVVPLTDVGSGGGAPTGFSGRPGGPGGPGMGPAGPGLSGGIPGPGGGRRLPGMPGAGGRGGRGGDF